MKEERKPKKRSRLPLKNKIKEDSLSGESILKSKDLPNTAIEAVIKEALQDMIVEKAHVSYKRKKQKDNLSAMVNVCSEFMSSFIIMGYDMNNKGIEPIFYAKNQLEADALSSYIQQFIVNSLHGDY
jgi:hypothetical protein